MLTYDNTDLIVPSQLHEELFIRFTELVNVYSLAVLEPPNSPSTLLVAATNKIYQVESNEENDIIKKEIPLPCLNKNGNIIAIAAHLDRYTGELHYAFTVSQADGESGPHRHSLHIHHAGKDCHEVPLKSMPYHLTHTSLPSTLGEQTVWVLTGQEMTVVGVLHQPQAHLNDSQDRKSSRTNKQKTDSTPVSFKPCSAMKPRESSTQSTSLDSSLNATETTTDEPSSTTEEMEPSFDCCLHEQVFKGPLLQKVFPEFSNINFCVLRIHMLRTPDDTRRITAVCGEDGSIIVTDVTLRSNLTQTTPSTTATKSTGGGKKKARKSNSSIKAKSAGSVGAMMLVEGCPELYAATIYGEKKIKFENVLSSVRLFPLIEPPVSYCPLLPPIPGVADEGRPVKTPVYSLLVTSTVGSSHVFKEITYERLRGAPLKTGEEVHDSVLCGIHCHLTGDHKMYLLLGTYDHKVMTFGISFNTATKEYKWVLRHTMAVCAPVLAMAHTDIIGDGIKRVVVLTAAGLQILTVDMKTTASAICNRLLSLTNRVRRLSPSNYKIKNREETRETQLSFDSGGSSTPQF